MSKKVLTRMRRAKRCRSKIRQLRMPWLCVHRTPQHIYAQLISPDGATVIATASTVEKAFKKAHAKTGDVAAATEVGKIIAERVVKAGIKNVAFDRSGFKYHGRVAALADAARAGGLEF